VNAVFSTTNNTLYYQALRNDIGVGLLPWIGDRFSFSQRNELRYISLKDAFYVYVYLLTNPNCDPDLRERHEKILKNVLKEKI
ncbi:MAG: hypothetical protein J6B76_05890, partial [Peptococcaceae bacterium]|nr:hypothetical protein [Peptococcaceae bacterium]